jgi:argininosuccinate lyase
MADSKKPQLWSKGAELNALVHRFTVDQDYLLDARLFRFDCLASAAHARMLGHVDLLSEAQVRALCDALHGLYISPLSISPEQEDCHTAIEQALTAALGDAGKRIHVARSRNDQVLTALRLLLRHESHAISEKLAACTAALLRFATRFELSLMPGYTHLQRAMPSSFGLWAQGFAEGLLEELDASAGLLIRLDRCPLGAAAGFGVPLAIDREYSAALLAFSAVQRAPTDCMNSRGRHEQALLDWLCSIAHTLEKLAWDLVLYSSQEFDLIRLPDAFTTGSSIMPNKRNPDVAELLRAHCRAIAGYGDSHRRVMSGLPSSYHRDFQLGKAPLLAAIASMHEMLSVLLELIPQITPQLENAKARCDDALYATHAAYAKVAGGMSFRDAYQATAAELQSGAMDATAFKVSDARANRFGLHAAHVALAAHQARIETLQSATQTHLNRVWFSD